MNKKEIKKSTNINIRILEAKKQEIGEMAKAKFQKKDLGHGDISKFILDELEASKLNFVYCPSCNKPCLDKRQTPISGIVKVKCIFCNHLFDNNF